MERGDGFWTSENKGWKTRRAEQDRYRRALDEQIEERRKMNPSRRGRQSRAETEAPKILDPVQHLMPWLNNPPGAQPAPQQHGQHHPPEIPTQAPLPPNYYFVANQFPHEPQQVPGQGQVQSQHPHPPLQGQRYQPPQGQGHGQPQPQHSSVTPQVQGNQQPQGSFAYFGSTPLPPPAEFAPPTTTSGHPAYQHPVHQQQPPIVPTGYFQHQQNDLHQEQAGHQTGTQSRGAYQQEQGGHHPGDGHHHHHTGQPATVPGYDPPNPSQNPVPPLNQGQDSPPPPPKEVKKIHVSQSSDKVPSPPSHDEYRMELARQVEEKRRQEAGRQQKEQEEEERFQRKILQQQEKLRREHEEEIRRDRENKEEEQRKIAQNRINLEIAQQKLEAEKQKVTAERQQQLKEAAKNSRTAHSTSPSRYYGGVSGRSKEKDKDTSAWAWDSTVIPVLQTTLSPKKLGTAEEIGAGDCNKPQRNHSHDRQLPSLPQSGRSSVPQSVRSSRTGTSRNESEFDETESNAAFSSRTFTKQGDSDQDDQRSQGSGVHCRGGGSLPGVSKSSEAVGTCTPEDMMMCPRCAKSFSSTDIQPPKTPAERRKFLDFLDNIHKKLMRDKAKLRDTEFDWSRQ